MKFIQLSKYPIPELPDTDKLFPFLNKNGNIYIFSFLISKSNIMLQLYLEHLGFKVEKITLPENIGLKNPDQWHFLVCGDEGIFNKLIGEEINDGIRVGPLTIIFNKSQEGSSAIVPDAIHINDDNINANDINFFNKKSAFIIKGLKYSDFKDDDWLFLWTDDKEDTRIEFVIPIVEQPDLIVDGVKFNFGFNIKFSGDKDKRKEEYWHACTLNVREIPINGGEEERLYIGDAAFETNVSVNGAEKSFSFIYESDIQSIIKLKGNNLLEIDVTTETDFLYIRFSKDNVTIHSYESTIGSPMRLSLELKFPLIMAPVGGSPSALALIIPLIDKANQFLEYKLDIIIGEEWEANEKPIFEYDSKSKIWKISDNLIETASKYGWNIITKQLNDTFLTLGGFDCSLNSLFGDTFGSAKFLIGTAPFIQNNLVKLTGDNIAIPMALSMSVGHKQVLFSFNFFLNLKNFRLSVNRLYIRNMPSFEGGDVEVIDFGVIAIILNNRIINSKQDTITDDYDGYFDFEKREFALIGNNKNPVNSILAIPGNLSEGDLSQRLLFEFQPFSPDYWPKETSEKVYLRINGEGISLYAKVITAHHPNILKESNSKEEGKISALHVVPLEKRSEEKVSEIVIINNTIRKAVLYGEFPVPATDGLLAQVEIGLRQNKKGSPPIIHAQIDLERANGKPLANLSAGYLQMQIDELRARLNWDLGKKEWAISVPVDASFMLSNKVSNTGGLDDLKKANVLKVQNLDLLNLHKGIGGISLPIPEVKFTCLDGMFAVSLKDLRFSWDDGSVNQSNKKFILTCEQADFAYLDPDTLQVSLEVGKVHLEFSGGSQIKMRNPERIGIVVSIDNNIRFAGQIAWVDNDKERFFAASGTLAIAGLPEATAMLKIGTGRKANGQIVPNIVFYGAMDNEVDIFAGVVAKSFGAGIGINNRLAGIDERPNAEKLLENLDRLEPSKIENWKFVERNGFYLSIVGTTIIASNRGNERTPNVYIASLLLSVDLHLNIVAAGKVWLASSLKYVRKKENWSRPALKGAISIHKNIFTAALESCPNPAIEEDNNLLKKILDKGHVKLSFLLSPKLVDFFLQDISYRDNFLGVDMLYQGSLRLALFKGVVLVRADQKITGHFAKTLEAGPGGFSCEGDLAVGIQFGGLFSSDGIAAYGMIAVQIMLNVDAWIVIGFSFSIGWGRWKKRISFSKTFRLPSTRLEIGLLGAVAFNEKGQFGFAGELTISVCICGYRLSISPSLKINDGVIADVRNRVAVFERSLDLYRQELLNGGGSTSMSDENPDNDKFWLHYQRGEWHLLVPNYDAEWFTPEANDKDKLSDCPFLKYVELIEIEHAKPNIENSENIEINIQLNMPWYISGEEISQDDLEEINAALLETTEKAVSETGTLRKKTRLKDYAVVTDPRIESDSREFWLDIDQALLPDHALPIRMKSADQILQSPPSDFGSTYGRLANYLACSQRSIIERRHSGSDLMPNEELEQRRAAFLYQMIEELKKADDDQYKSPWIAQGDNGKRRGLIFKDSKIENIESIKIKRNKQDLQEVKVKNVNTDAKEMRQAVRLCSLRQEYVIDKPIDKGNGSKREEGRVVVKLPLSYQDSFFHEYLPFFSHIEVWRRIRGFSGEIRIGSYQLPSMIFLQPSENIKEQIVVDPYIFSDHFRVTRTDEGKPVFDLGVTADATVIEYAVKVIAVGADSSEFFSSWQSVKLHLPEFDTFPIDLGMIFDVSELYKKDEWAPRFQMASMGDERITLALTDEWHRLFQPVTEEGSSLRKFEIWAEERPIVGSGFYAGTESEERKYPSDQENTAVLSTEQPVIFLHDKFKVSVEAVENCFWKISQAELFRDGYAYRFYIRPIFAGASAKEIPDLLRPLDVLLSKSIPDVAPNKSIEILPINFPVSLKEKYVWYETGKDGVFIPAVPKGRAVQQIEWIGTQQLSPEEFKEFIPIAASVRPLEDKEEDTPEKLRRQIGLSWNFSGATWGGVEFQIADKDDSAVAARFVCEVQEYSSFQHSIHNFANDSAWRLTNQERLSRLNYNSEVATFKNVEIKIDIVNQTLLLDQDSNKLIQQLELTGKEFINNLDSDWKTAASHATQFIKIVRKYQQAPINLNDKIFQAVLLKAEALIRYLFVGIDIKDEDINTKDRNDSDILKKVSDKINSIDSDLKKRLHLIDELNLQADKFDDTDIGRQEAQFAVLDRDCARKLVAIIRRRMAIGEDVLAGAGDNLPLSYIDNEGDWLPRGKAFQEIRKKMLPNTNTGRLLQKIFPENADKNPSVSEQLKDTIKELLNLSEFNIDEKSPDIIRRKDVASIVTRAAGLTAALEFLDGDTKHYIDKRPHHVISVVKDSDGKKVPEQIEMKKLLPDTHRDLSNLGLATETASSSEADLAAYFNLLERMGFAVDLAGADENGEPLTQQELIRYIKEKGIKNVIDNSHYIYLITPREPDSEYRGGFPDAETIDTGKRDNNYFYVGFSFVKLAIIPKAFHDCLTQYCLLNMFPYCLIDGEKNDRNVVDVGSYFKKDIVKELIEWFGIRGIKDVTLDHLRVFAKAAHFASFPLTGEDYHTASNDFHFHHIRMTPLQLHHISVPHVKGFAHINWQVPDQFGHRFVVSARPMSRYEPFIRWAKETPLSQLAPANFTEVNVHRIIVAKEDSADVPASLPVSIFPHPEHLRFGYTLPSAGVRSLLNRISLIRTGYKGCQLIFQHHLIDQEEGKQEWGRIITSMVNENKDISLDQLVTVRTPRNSSSDVRLFRNERLISLEEMPYYYCVKLSVISKFEGDLKGNKKQEEVSPLYAQRMPTVIAYRLPEIPPEVEDGAGGYTYTVKIVLTRLAEMASYAELHSGIPEQKEEGYPVQDLPVPFLGYHFYYWIPSGKSEAPDSDSIYQSVIELLMPWHEGYIADKSPDASGSGKPFVRTFDSGITVTEPYPEITMKKIETGKYVPIVELQFTTTGENKLLFKEQKRRYMQVSCYGKLTPATSMPISTSNEE
ncbi:MAG: hypothetical protein ACTFAL_12080 [Candidatus Electronema sp. V4]|uniref:hypothetical protein n=1 Tax=Candidatus Electronema sp. V4 TaxID=3454756 RepID=UPI0040553C20